MVESGKLVPLCMSHVHSAGFDLPVAVSADLGALRLPAATVAPILIVVELGRLQHVSVNFAQLDAPRGKRCHRAAMSGTRAQFVWRLRVGLVARIFARRLRALLQEGQLLLDFGDLGEARRPGLEVVLVAGDLLFDVRRLHRILDAVGKVCVLFLIDLYHLAGESCL